MSHEWGAGEPTPMETEETENGLYPGATCEQKEEQEIWQREYGAYRPVSEITSQLTVLHISGGLIQAFGRSTRKSASSKLINGTDTTLRNVNYVVDKSSEHSRQAYCTPQRRNLIPS